MLPVGFTYRDKAGLLHAVADEATAKKNSGNGNYRTFNGRFAKGFPTVGGYPIMDKLGQEPYIAGGDDYGDIPLKKMDFILRKEVKLILAEAGL